ncbi:MAG: polyprenyl synthetase family protein [Candidatus Nanohaloarchaea archaeon]
MTGEEELEQDGIEDLFPEEAGWCDSPVLEEGVRYAREGGKRIRPLLCLRMTSSLGGDERKARVFARSIESMHNATLVQDDIQDGDEYRRGRESAWKRYGRDQAINIGEALFADGYRHLVVNRDMFEEGKWEELIRVFNQAHRTVIDGQAMDIAMRESSDVGEEEYFDMVKKKTGSLLGASLQAAVVISGQQNLSEPVREISEDLGPAFQIRDDVIDLVGEKGRKKEGNDIREGKRSLVVVKALERLENGEELVKILDRKRDATTEEDVRKAIGMMESVDAIEDANREAEELAENAKAELEKIGESYPVEDVLEITDFLVERSF